NYSSHKFEPIRRKFVNCFRVIFAALLLSVSAFADVTVSYKARVILGAYNQTALNDLLRTFGLNVEAGPNGPEAKFSGTFTFDPTTPNLVVGTGARATSGQYKLAAFNLNGIEMQPGPAPLSAGTPAMTLNVACCRTGVGQDDGYVVALSDTTP